MTNLEPSEKAGPEEVGFSSPANQVEAKKQPEACQRGRQPKNAEHLHQTSPNGRTRCRMRNKLHRRSPAAELGANLRKATSNRPGLSAPSGGPHPDPHWMRVRVSKARTSVPKADLSAHCSCLLGSRDGRGMDVK